MSVPSKSLLIVTPDLFLGSQIVGAAKAAGVEFDRVLSGGKALDRLTENHYRLAVIDLGAEGIDLQKLSDQSGKTELLGYASHVKVDLIKQAQEIGISVLTKGQISSQAESIFHKLAENA